MHGSICSRSSGCNDLFLQLTAHSSLFHAALNQATSAGLGVLLNKMLVIDNALFAAVALAHPAGVSSVVAVFEFKHGQVAKALTCQIFSRVGHGGSLRSIKKGVNRTVFLPF